MFYGENGAQSQESIGGLSMAGAGGASPGLFSVHAESSGRWGKLYKGSELNSKHLTCSNAHLTALCTSCV